MDTFGINDFILLDSHIVKVNKDYVDTNTDIVEEYAQILSSIPGPLNIMYSGGIDSEIVAEVCQRYSIPHKLHFMALVHKNKIFNDVDYRNAIEFSNNVEIHYLDFYNFFGDGDYIEYAIKYKTQSPQLACHLKVASDIGNHVVFGGDTMYFYYNHDYQAIEFKTTSFGHFCYHFLVKEIGGIGNMANASYSLLIKWLHIQADLAKKGIINHVWENPNINLQKFNYNWKCSMYREAGFTAKPKQNKMTGFETIKTFYSDKYNEIGTIRKFDELYRNPLKTIVNLPSVPDTVVLVPEEIKKLCKKFGENYDKSCN